MICGGFIVKRFITNRVLFRGKGAFDRRRSCAIRVSFDEKLCF